MRVPQQIEDSRAPFLVVDETGRVEIDPDAAIVDSQVVTTNELRSGPDDRSLVLVQEWIVAPDQPLLAYGVQSRVDPADTSVPAGGRSPRAAGQHARRALYRRGGPRRHCSTRCSAAPRRSRG